MAAPYYFRCRKNPKAPLLVLHTYWEAQEMKTNPDYDETDEMGLPVVTDEGDQEARIPFDKPTPKAAAK